MRTLALRLIAAERRAGESGQRDLRAAVRVCGKLRDLLSPLTGKRGFRALGVRALALAADEVAWLRKVELKEGVEFVLPGDAEDELKPEEAARGGVTLVTHLLELLATFIGEALTRRLVQQVWPSTASGDPKSEGKT